MTLKRLILFLWFVIVAIALGVGWLLLPWQSPSYWGSTPRGPFAIYFPNTHREIPLEGDAADEFAQWLDAVWHSGGWRFDVQPTSSSMIVTFEDGDIDFKKTRLVVSFKDRNDIYRDYTEGEQQMMDDLKRIAFGAKD